MNFVKFLKKNKMYDSYMTNRRIENQRWSVINYYKDLELIQSLKPELWISRAFSWERSPEGYEAWYNLDHKWNEIISRKKNIRWE